MRLADNSVVGSRLADRPHGCNNSMPHGARSCPCCPQNLAPRPWNGRCTRYLWALARRPGALRPGSSSGVICCSCTGACRWSACAASSRRRWRWTPGTGAPIWGSSRWKCTTSGRDSGPRGAGSISWKPICGRTSAWASSTACSSCRWKPARGLPCAWPVGAGDFRISTRACGHNGKGSASSSIRSAVAAGRGCTWSTRREHGWGPRALARRSTSSWSAT